jgi:hypothetical protein
LSLEIYATLIIKIIIESVHLNAAHHYKTRLCMSLKKPVLPIIASIAAGSPKTKLLTYYHTFSPAEQLIENLII